MKTIEEIHNIAVRIMENLDCSFNMKLRDDTLYIKDDWDRCIRYIDVTEIDKVYGIRNLPL